MRPVGIIVKSDTYIIRHICEKCGHEKNNKSSVNDNFSEILKISAKND